MGQAFGHAPRKEAFGRAGGADKQQVFAGKYSKHSALERIISFDQTVVELIQ
ncbi:hypothetical protein AZKH_1149 [Azoarcus sp. KH32C]|nr:hypothetical protein AZKH_1149 [Azoarcus sp. KH32C]